MADESYISKADYLYQIRTNRLEQILEETDEDEDAILDAAEAEALAVIRMYLVKYDLNTEFGKTGNARSKIVLRWAKVLVIYYIYERVPDEMCPERVVKNYEKALEQLEAVLEGDAQVPGLNQVQEADPGTGDSVPVTRRRWGSIPKRTNDGGSPRYKDR
jgi:phage gp36-like protein